VSVIDPPHARRPASGAVLGQSALVLSAASVAWGLTGRAAALSVLGGAAVAWVTTLYARHRALAPAGTVNGALLRVMVGELIKVVATIALFAAAARVPHLVWPGLLSGYALALIGGWLSQVCAARREQQVIWAREKLASQG
jgi:F0F1-type ATP synthase assembly protein I